MNWGRSVALVMVSALALSIAGCQSRALSPAAPAATYTAIHPQSALWTVFLPGGAALHPSNPERLQGAFDAVVAAAMTRTGSDLSSEQLSEAYAPFGRVERDYNGIATLITQAGPLRVTRAAVARSQGETVVLMQDPSRTWSAMAARDPDGGLYRALADVVLAETGVRLAQSQSPTAPAATSTTPALFIKITEPAPGSRLSATVTVRGRAGAIFENEFPVELLDADGVKLATAIARVSASVPGGPGEFVATLSWTLPAKPSAGVVWAYERSAKDGGISAQDKLQVWLEAR